MSASREKKQRQNDLTDGLTQKQRREAQEAAAQQKKNKVYVAVGVIIAIAVAALLIWNSPLVQRPDVAAVVDGKEYSSAELNYYYSSAFQYELGSLYNYAMYGLDVGYDFSKPASEQIKDEASGQTWQEYLREQAIDLLRQTVALTKAAKAEGYTLSEDGKAMIQADLKQLGTTAMQKGTDRAGYLKQAYGRFMTSAVYEKCLEQAALAADYAQAHAKTLTYDSAALDAYYGEHKDELDTFYYDYYFFSGKAESAKDEDGETVEPTEEESKAAMDAAKEKADALAEALKNGETVDEESITTVNKAQSGVGAKLNSTYQEWLTDADRTQGDVTVIDTDTGCYVVRFTGRELVEDGYATAGFRHILVKAELGEDDPATEDVNESEKPTDEAMAAAKAEAQALLDQWLAGDKTAESFAALANEHSDDPGSNTKGGLYENVRPNQMVPSVNDWIFSGENKVGDTGLVENTNRNQYGWHVMYLDSIGMPVWEDTAATALRTDDQNAWVDELMEPITGEAKDGMSQVG